MNKPARPRTLKEARILLYGSVERGRGAGLNGTTIQRIGAERRIARYFMAAPKSLAKMRSAHRLDTDAD